MKSMRVGFDAFNAWILCGNSIYTKNLILGLSEIAPDLELHLFTQRRRLRRTQASIGVNSSLYYRPCLLHPLMFGTLLEGLVKRANRMILRREASRLDLFHCTNPAHYPLGAQRVVMTLLDLVSLRNENWTSEGSKRYYRRYIQRIVESSSAITTISAYTKSELARYFPQALDKTKVIHIAGNPLYQKTEPDMQVLNDYGLPGDRPFVLYVGQYQPRKNIVGMLTAFSRLDEDLRSEFAFVLAGSKMKEHMFVDIAKEVDSLKGRIDVRMLVNVPDRALLHLYNAASLFVFLPFYEGFGVPVVEAMGCGCPVLASSVTSIPEVAGDGAMLVNPENTEEISAAMEKLLRDQALREDLARRGLERGRQFSWRRTASETLDMYAALT